MGRINRDIVIDAPSELVYAYVSDPRNAPKYISSITKIVSGPAGRPEVGQKWVAEADFLGGNHMLDLRIVQLVPNESVGFSLEGSINAEVSILLTASPRNTRTAVALYLGVESVPSLLLTGLLGGLLSEDMQRLKRALET